MSNNPDVIVFCLNAHDTDRSVYSFNKLLLNGDDKRFGGNGHEIPAEINAVKGACNYKDYNISFDLPPYTAAVFIF